MKLKTLFDGNYYKIKVDDLDKHLIVIQGVNRKDKSCFVQYAFEGDEKSTFHSFSFSDFQHKENVTYIDKNIFAPHLIYLDLPKLKLSLKLLTEHQKNELKPINTMGLLKKIPFIQCKHEIISLAENCELSINNYSNINTKSKGMIYAERNWGYSFPSQYLWLHCYDYFEGSPVEFQFAAAKPRFLGIKPKVHLGILNYKNCTYNFGILNNSKFKIENYDSENSSIRFLLKNKTCSLTCSLSKGLTTQFISPNKNGMKGEIGESLNANIALNFKSNTNSFNFTSQSASAELINLKDF